MRANFNCAPRSFTTPTLADFASLTFFPTNVPLKEMAPDVTITAGKRWDEVNPDITITTGKTWRNEIEEALRKYRAEQDAKGESEGKEKEKP